LRGNSNEELFRLYEQGELVFRYRSQRGLKEAKRVLSNFQAYLGNVPPNTKSAKSFLAQFTSRKPATKEASCRAFKAKGKQKGSFSR
jgi:hypothetical protein